MRAVHVTSVLLIVASLVHAQSPVTWTVTPGFEGLYQANAWSPVTVQLTNAGPATQGQLVVPTGEGAAAPGSVVPSGPAAYSLPIDLPRQARKQYTLCVPASGIQAVHLRLNSGTAKQEMPSTAKQLGVDDELVVVIGGEGNALGLLNGVSVPAPDGFVKTAISITRSASGSGSRSSSGGSSRAITLRVSVAHVPWGELPDNWLAWDGVGVAVLTDANLSLAPPEAVPALTQWVRLGGTLIVPGGAAGSALAGTAIGPMLPMEATGTTAVSSLDQLATWTGQAAPTGATLMVTGKLRPGAKALLGTMQSPLVLSWQVGSGRVMMPLFDFTLRPVRYWSGQERLWQLLLANSQLPGLARRLEGQFNRQGSGFSSRLAQTLPQNRAPSQTLLLCFVLVYALVLSPGQYLVLKRMRRTELGWIVTPVLVLFFCLVAYGLTTQVRGREAILQRLTVIETASGANIGRGQGWVGLFSTASKRHTLALGAGVAGARLPADQQEGGKPTIWMGPEPQVRDFGVNMWTLRTCGVEYSADLGKGIEIVEAGWDGRIVQLHVRNGTRLNFKDCRVICGGRVSKLGAMAAGADLKGTFTQTSGSSPASSPMSGMPPSFRMGRPSPFGSAGASTPPDDPVEIMVSALVEGSTSGSSGGSSSSSGGGSGYSYSYSTTSAASGSPRQQSYFVAITSDPLLPVELVGHTARTRDVGIVVVPVEVRLKAGQTVRVPEWLIEQQTLSTRSVRQRTSTVWSSTAGSPMTRRQITQTERERTTLFQLPTGPNGGTLASLTVDSRFGLTASLRLLNHQTGQWQGPPSGFRSRSWQVGNPAPYMDSQGRMIVRNTFTYDPPSGLSGQISATIRSR